MSRRYIIPIINTGKSSPDRGDCDEVGAAGPREGAAVPAVPCDGAPPVASDDWATNCNGKCPMKVLGAMGACGVMRVMDRAVEL
jgi:hypothetical protein